MFIRKWRYEQNMAKAREEGCREGYRVANEQKFAYTEYLEEENKTLQDKLAEAESTIERLRQELETGALLKKSIVEAFAQELACCQKMADVAYYTKGNQEESSCLLDKAFALKEVASKLGICADVFARAYEIYDFRNSGKKGYTLKDGKIVKVEQEEAVLECPFVEEPEAENCVGDSSGDEITVCCPEVSDTPDSQENCCAVQGFCDEETFF